MCGRQDWKRPLGRPRRRWENYIKIELKEAGWILVDWFDSADDRDRGRALVNAVVIRQFS